MFSIWTTVGLGILSLSLFVYSIIKHEERLQKMERSIAEVKGKNLNN